MKRIVFLVMALLFGQSMTSFGQAHDAAAAGNDLSPLLAQVAKNGGAVLVQLALGAAQTNALITAATYMGSAAKGTAAEPVLTSIIAELEKRQQNNEIWLQNPENKKDSNGYKKKADEQKLIVDFLQTGK